MISIATRAPIRGLGVFGPVFFIVFSGSSTASGPAGDPESFLSITKQADGRCQILSSGGKLAVIRNSHPSRDIRFRLVRLFVDVPQQGRASGIASAGENAQKLGCTLVDGREQRWVVESAEFATAATK